MTRFTLHVPLNLNDGSATPAEHIAHVEDTILATAGGYTATDAVGAWRDELGRVYRDSIRLYTVDTSDPETVSAALTVLAEYLALELEQEAIYATWQPLAAALVTAPAVEIPAAI